MVIFWSISTALAIFAFWFCWWRITGSMPMEPSIVFWQGLVLPLAVPRIVDLWVGPWLIWRLNHFLKPLLADAKRDQVVAGWAVGTLAGLAFSLLLHLAISLPVAFAIAMVVGWLVEVTIVGKLEGPLERPYYLCLGFSFAWPVMFICGIVIGWLTAELWYHYNVFVNGRPESSNDTN